MQPEEAFRSILESFCDENRKAAVMYLASMATWLEKGGDMPNRAQVEDVIGDLADKCIGGE